MIRTNSIVLYLHNKNEIYRIHGVRHLVAKKVQSGSSIVLDGNCKGAQLILGTYTTIEARNYGPKNTYSQNVQLTLFLYYKIHIW